MSFCFPSRCSCCTCQGIHCLFYHPGHNHAELTGNGVWFKGIYIPFDKGVKDDQQLESDGGEDNDPKVLSRK